MAPISNTEIAFLRFNHDNSFRKIPGIMSQETDGGVAIFDIVKNKVTNLIYTDLKFATEYNTCI